MRARLDSELNTRGLVQSRSQAENYIKLGFVEVNNKKVTKPSFMIAKQDEVKLTGDKYVSRAALKLASVAEIFNVKFNDKVVLDVGSSTGGFSDFSLQHGAKKVIAVDVGTDQFHPSLRQNERVELHEKTDIREFLTDEKIDVVVVDVSFISLRKILPSLKKFVSPSTELIVMCKPQFEAEKNQVNKGIIKNSSIRREILKDFERWLAAKGFVVKCKSDSQVAGAKGNIERFYCLKVIR